MRFFLILTAVLFLACDKGKNDHSGHDHAGHDHSGHDHSGHDHSEHDHDHDDHDHDDHDHDEHGHAAPNGGVLKELDGHKASIEWLVEKDGLSVYIFDGCAEKAMRVAHEKLEVTLITGTEKKDLVLQPVVSELTGDKVGAASSFQIKQDGVKFDSVEEIQLKLIEIQGITYKDVTTRIKK